MQCCDSSINTQLHQQTEGNKNKRFFTPLQLMMSKNRARFSSSFFSYLYIALCVHLCWSIDVLNNFSGGPEGRRWNTKVESSIIWRCFWGHDLQLLGEFRVQWKLSKKKSSRTSNLMTSCSRYYVPTLEFSDFFSHELSPTHKLMFMSSLQWNFGHFQASRKTSERVWLFLCFPL